MSTDNRLVESEDILVALGLSRERARRLSPDLEDSGVILLVSVPSHFVLFREPVEDVLAGPEDLRRKGNFHEALQTLENLRGEAEALGDAQLRDAFMMRIAYGLVHVHADKREWREARIECRQALQLWAQYPWLAELRILPLDLLYGALARCCEGLGYGYEEEASEARAAAERFAPRRPAPAKEPVTDAAEAGEDPEPASQSAVKLSTSTPKDDPRRKRKGKSKF
ncbi:hypothetical protein BD626DRAFT_564384 [Schizophyllum amplum]|uniref:Uncharacterized protein n=1 Tax=Schizophyllum amplum TaxID=97359 RepID=A0A550CRN5_9AGAR|nr:hypothetical protein BD626DRAFT_564384 [Auriculariopsis ampla]